MVRVRDSGSASRWAGISPGSAAFERHSIAATASRLAIPLTVHVAIGTDIVHMHPLASGAAMGEASLRDFRYFTSRCRTTRARRRTELRICGHSPRSVPQGCRAGAKPGLLARGAYNRQSRLSPSLPAAHQRRGTANRRRWTWIRHYWPSRDHDPTPRSGAD